MEASTTYAPGSVTTRTSGPTGGFDPSALRDALIARMRANAEQQAPQRAQVVMAAPADSGYSARSGPAVGRGPGFGAPGGNMADYEDADIAFNDAANKTAMQRIQDRANRKMAIRRIPTNDRETGAVAQDNLSAEAHGGGGGRTETGDVGGFAARNRASVAADPQSAATRTAIARTMAGW